MLKKRSWFFEIILLDKKKKETNQVMFNLKMFMLLFVLGLNEGQAILTSNYWFLNCFANFGSIYISCAFI